MKGASGFTLLEVMVSMLLFLIVSATMASTFVSHLKRNTDTEVRSGAAALAQRRLDELRLVDPPTMPASGTTSSNQSAGGRNYVVQTSYCENLSLCSSSNNRHLAIRVLYAGGIVFQTETVYTRLR